MSENYNPLVSIIIPVFNGENHIQLAIDSVLSQSYQNWELIIVDDGSSDGTLHLINKAESDDTRIKSFLRTSSPKGASTCRNSGIEMAKSDYIIFLDADDVLLPHCLSQRLIAMQENPEIEFGVFPQLVKYDDEIREEKLFNLACDQREDLIALFLNFKIPWQTSSPIWRSNFLKYLQGFDTTFFRMEDPDLHLRALLATDKFKHFYNAEIDCIYNLRKFDSKEYLSISSKIAKDTFVFLSKRIADIPKLNSISIPRCKVISDMEIGFFHVMKFYFVSRITYLKDEYVQVKNLLVTNGILSFQGRFRLFLFEKIFLYDSRIIKILRLRGILFNLLF
jgi:glycosyltransferase involved in cell wall biosynthesis